MNIRKFGQVNGLTNQPIGLDVGAGINTGDATATAADIVSGKTAYGVLGKLTGTNTNPAEATGSVTSSGSTFPFIDSGGAAFNKPEIVVTGLTFLPVRIVITQTTTGIKTLTEYDANYLYDAAATTNICYSDTSGPMVAVKLDGSVAKVTSTGFTLPVFGTSRSYTWTAYQS